MRSVARWITCFVVATIVWVATLHLWFQRSAVDLRSSLAARQLSLWEPDGQHELLRVTRVVRATNPEWDLMARMFDVLAFANMALREPTQQARYLRAIDSIIDRTEDEIEANGAYHFLLPYAYDKRFTNSLRRSLFTDGELALMMAVRQLVSFDATRVSRTRRWVAYAISHLEEGPVLLGESYPDEVWLFCNSVALAAIRLHDETEGAPARHRELFTRWIASARKHVIDPATGMFASKTGLDGSVREGPEGSTIWLTATMLRIVDDELARDQYRRARTALGRNFAGFAWAREWPPHTDASDDVDSGPTIPIVGANAGSSGLALVAATAFGDDAFADDLVSSLAFAGFPIDGGARFAAGNHVADAVITYALTSGPLWDRILGASR